MSTRKPAKRGPGQPPRAGVASRERIELRVTEAELRLIDQRARAAGLDRSAFVRARALWGDGPAVDTPPLE